MYRFKNTLKKSSISFFFFIKIHGIAGGQTVHKFFGAPLRNLPHNEMIMVWVYTINNKIN